MKKAIAREFLWLIITLVFALVLSFIFLAYSDWVTKDDYVSEGEKIFTSELFFIAYIFNFIGIYIGRLIFASIKVVSKKE